MQRWIVPMLAVSFVGAMWAGGLSTPPPLDVTTSLAGASIPATVTSTEFAQLASTSIATAAASCRGPFTVSAAQIIVVAASGTRATLAGCTRNGNSYQRTLGPFPARVGRNGVAPAGRKREGDGRTPSGTFALGPGFGTASSPGLRPGWLQVGAQDVWVDDARSPLYNTHQRLPAAGRWRSAERLKIPAYRYAQVIGYNTDRIPGRGSAIFMHVGTTPTAGCVALATPDLVRVLRWERSGAVIVIA